MSNPNNKKRFPWSGAKKFEIPQLTNKDIIMKLSSFDVIFATEYEEFYYKDTDEVVPEGEPIGVDVDHKDGVELVLFSNIYWNPQY